MISEDKFTRTGKRKKDEGIAVVAPHEASELKHESHVNRIVVQQHKSTGVEKYREMRLVECRCTHRQTNPHDATCPLSGGT